MLIEKIYQAPVNTGKVVLGRTLPSLLDEACDRAPNHKAFNQWSEAGWQSLSNQAFLTAAENVALGLWNLGLEKGDRVALLMFSDVRFCLVDLGCLLANLVDVPIDLTQTLEHILFVLRHSEAKVLVISNLDLLAQVMPYLSGLPDLQFVVVADVHQDWPQTRSDWMASQIRGIGSIPSPRSSRDTNPASACLDIPMFLHPAQLDQPHGQVPRCLQVFSLEEVRTMGVAESAATRLPQLRANLTADQLATIIYIPDDQGQLEGVMLTHENLSGNALAAFSEIADLGRGAQEIVLSFLPLNHVLARTMLYGHIYYGHTIYFSNPNRLLKHLKEIQPTILVSVPLLLEKIYSKILEKGSKASPHLSGSMPVAPGLLFPRSLFQLPQIALTHLVFQWALKLAKQYELGSPPKGCYGWLLKLADWLVLSKWRAVFGGRLKYLICGGAALKAELANVFAAAGVTILQGYGLTQASAVVTCNRGRLNRAGTVGVPIAGVEVAIAEDGEILVRAPYVTPGYYKNPQATQQLMNEQGWLHTGDLGAFTPEGFLKITGMKKALFKLSTGKYIAPQPIEQRLKQSPLIAQAIVVGSERKFCAALIVPNLEALHTYALETGLDLAIADLLKHPCIVALYQALVNAANCRLPYWATVKRFRLLHADFTVENGLLTSTQAVNRAHVLRVFAPEIEGLYGDETHREEGLSKDAQAHRGTEAQPEFSVCPPVPSPACPAYAQSLNPRLTT